VCSHQPSLIVNSASVIRHSWMGRANRLRNIRICTDIHGSDAWAFKDHRTSGAILPYVVVAGEDAIITIETDRNPLSSAPVIPVRCTC